MYKCKWYCSETAKPICCHSCKEPCEEKCFMNPETCDSSIKCMEDEDGENRKC